MSGLLPTPRELVPARLEDIEARLRRLERGRNYAGLAWSTYVPTLKATGGGSASLGDGTLGGVYGLGGGTAVVQIEMVWGSTTSITGSSWGFSLPATPSYLDGAGLGQFPSTGHCHLMDSSASGANTSGMCYLSTAGGTGHFVFMRRDGGTTVTPTSPFTWAANDLVTLTIIYPT